LKEVKELIFEFKNLVDHILISKLNDKIE